MKFKAVIFDLDGTLVDTLDDLTDSVNHGLGRFSLPKQSTESIRLKVGDGTATMVGRCLPDDRQDLLEEVLPQVVAYYGEHFCDKSRPYAGVVEMLVALKRRQLCLAVLSNKPERFTRLVVERLFAAGQFDEVAGHRDGVPLKPDPSSALALADQLGTRPGEIAYVGDSDTDMLTARAAGMYAVGVTWGFRDRDVLVAAGSEVLIDEPGELPGVLGL